MYNLRVLVSSVLLICLITVSHGLSQSKEYDDEEFCNVNNSAFNRGELVTYIVYYNWNFIWVPAGEVRFYVDEVENNWHFIARGRTYPSYEWFYKVDDKYESVVDKDNLQPVFFERDIEEGKYKFYNKLEFDQHNKKVVSYVGKDEYNLKKKETLVDNCIHDVLSLIYRTRNLNISDIKPGEEIPMNMFIDHDEYNITMKYEGKVSGKKIRGQGRFDALHISPELIVGNIFGEDQRMNIWVSDDANRLPLLIESPISVGSIKVVLKDYNGLKHPLSAKN